MSRTSPAEHVPPRARQHGTAERAPLPPYRRAVAAPPPTAPCNRFLGPPRRAGDDPPRFGMTRAGLKLGRSAGGWRGWVVSWGSPQRDAIRKQIRKDARVPNGMWPRRNGAVAARGRVHRAGIRDNSRPVGCCGGGEDVARSENPTARLSSRLVRASRRSQTPHWTNYCKCKKLLAVKQSVGNCHCIVTCVRQC